MCSCASPQARRIHVGNLPSNGPIDNEVLSTFFEQAMIQAGFKNADEGTCVKDVWISGEKKFGARPHSRDVRTELGVGGSIREGIGSGFGKRG